MARHIGKKEPMHKKHEKNEKLMDHKESVPHVEMKTALKHKTAKKK